MDTSSEPEIWSVLQTGMRSYLKVNTRMVLPREVHVKLGQRMLRAGLRMRVPFRREPRTAPAAARAVATQGTSLCTVRKYIHLSGTESPRQGATWAHSPARPPGRLRPAGCGDLSDHGTAPLPGRASPPMKAGAESGTHDALWPPWRIP